VSEKLESVGEKITLVGLILQAVSYGFFCILLVKSHISIKSNHASLTHKFSIILIWILYFSSAFLSVRPPPFRSQSLPLNPHVASLYLPCRRVCSGTRWLPPNSRR